jgi:GNAT superfamily N-acetyltransferase
VEIRRVRADEWRTLRELRLDALREAPYAFVTRYEQALEYPDEDWRARTSWNTFVAVDGTRFVGMATGVAKDAPATAALIQMYVRPEARGTGVAAALVDAVVAWARAEGYARVELGVAVGNERAERLYVRCGFARTGEVVHIDGFGDDVRMALRLDRHRPRCGGRAAPTLAA